MKPCKKHPKGYCVCAVAKMVKGWSKGDLASDLWLPKDSTLIFGGIDWGVKDLSGYTGLFNQKPLKFESNVQFTTLNAEEMTAADSAWSAGTDAFVAYAKKFFGGIRAETLRETSRWDAEDKAMVN